jgi:hypothetical protein
MQQLGATYPCFGPEPTFGVHTKFSNAGYLLIKAQVIEQLCLRGHNGYDTAGRIIHRYAPAHHICKDAFVHQSSRL